jgi:hypothetical protein
MSPAETTAWFGFFAFSEAIAAAGGGRADSDPGRLQVAVQVVEADQLDLHLVRRRRGRPKHGTAATADGEQGDDDGARECGALRRDGHGTAPLLVGAGMLVHCARTITRA